jgi:formylmethanofuran dehydrogenase subunit E
LPVEVSVEGSCAIDGYQVTMTSGTGECTLTATQAGSDDYLAAEAVIRKVDAAKASQSIQFDEPQSPVRRGTVFSVSPQATSGLPVVVTAEGSCTIDGYQVTVTGMSGYCTLTASQEGDENYLPAPNVVHAIEVIPDQMFVYLPLLVNLTH